MSHDENREMQDKVTIPKIPEKEFLNSFSES